MASKSPRRHQLMHECGYTFTVQVQDTDEDFDPAMPALEVAPFLAQKKAHACRNFLKTPVEILLTADSVVVIDGDVLNKPADYNEAFAMIRRLSGNMHTVVTGVCLLDSAKEIVFKDETKVWLAAMTDEAIDYYVKNYAPFDKAGSYGIQDWIGLTHIARIDGSYSNVMGLPTAKVYQYLQSFL
ncbi:MAG: hypothetical protein RI894_1192 [Bacteroidota bacterium]